MYAGWNRLDAGTGERYVARDGYLFSLPSTPHPYSLCTLFPYTVSCGLFAKVESLVIRTRARYGVIKTLVRSPRSGAYALPAGVVGGLLSGCQVGWKVELLLKDYATLWRKGNRG
jgi:hypothetical protein